MSTGAGNCPECLKIDTLVCEPNWSTNDDIWFTQPQWRCTECGAIFDETDMIEIRKKTNANH